MAWYVMIERSDGTFYRAGPTPDVLADEVAARFEVVDVGSAPLPGQVWNKATRTFIAPNEEIDRIIDELQRRGLFPLSADGLRAAWPFIMRRIESGR